MFIYLQSSWKLALRNSFKKFRRGSLKEDAYNENSAPQAKRLRVTQSDDPDITEDDYDNAVQELKGW